MRILPVAQLLAALERQRDPLGPSGGIPLQIAMDGGVVGGGVGEDLRGQLPTQPGAYAPGHVPPLESSDHDRIIIGIDDHDHVAVILRGGAQHRRPTDVDLLDRLLERHVGPRDRFAERIEVHRDQVDRRDTVLGQRGAVAGMVTAGEQAAMHLGVQRLHAAVHHLGETGDLLDREDGNAGLAQRVGRPASRHDLPVEGGELAGEVHEAALVGDREQRPHQASAAAWIRSARLATSFRSTSSAGEWE